MWTLDEYIVTKPDGDVEFLDYRAYIKRMVNFMVAIKGGTGTFEAWAKKRGIPAPVRREGEIVAISSEHIKSYLEDNGYKFEKI